MNILLSRIDERLIHGQVMTRWITGLYITRIILIDDAIAKDDFMVDVLLLSAPVGVDVQVMTVEEAVKRGICKVNYATELRAAFSEGVKEVMKADPAVYDPKKYNKAGREKVKQLVMKRIDNLGSAGRA